MLDIVFSEPVGLPWNVTQWSSLNEGSEFLDIAYLPNEKS